MIYTYCSKPYLTITSDVQPFVEAQTPLDIYSDDDKNKIEKKPFINRRRIVFDINYEGRQYCLLISRGYRWDGSSIPPFAQWLIGANSNPKFLIASMVHDKVCENHNIIDNDRYLASLLYRELLIASDVNVVSAYTQFHCVDNFQKVAGDW